MAIRTVLLFIPWLSAAQPWRNTSLPIPERVAALIAELNLTEKVALLSASSPAIARIGLPAYNWASECERGDTSGPTGTAFPSGIALGSTFNSSLVQEVAFATAVETRANYDTHPGSGLGASCFGPVTNFIRDPRWGRTNEMLGGECTTLASRLGVAFTLGIQRGSVPSSSYRMINTIAKHLSSYSGPEGYCGGVSFATQSRFSFTAHMDERTWREFFLPPWRAMAVEAKVSGFMSSYMAVDLTGGQGAGVPDSASRLLLTDTIRSDWNWSGYILSDAGAVAFVGTTDWQGTDIGHGYSPNASAAAAAALDAGLDLELTCCDLPTVFPTLVESVLSGQVSEAAIDTALHRTLPIRFELGTLDPPGSSPYDNFTAANVSAPWMIDLALEAARQGLVLLKNADVPGSLPWSPRALAGKTIAVIGFTANQTQGQEGGYVNQNPPFIRTTLDGITDAFPLSIVGFTSGCSSYACPTLDVAGVASAAADADAVIVVLGTTVTNGVMPDSPCSPDNVAMEAEGWDRAGTQLPGMQLNLLQTAASAVRQGTPILLVLINAGMLDVGWAVQAASVTSILHAPMLGMTSGIAIADGITGRVNPAGRLTHTWYTPDGLAAIGNITDYRMHPDASGYPGRTYRYTRAGILFPFGFGLSYSKWRYGPVSIAPIAAAPCDTIRLSVTLFNDSPIDGSEVVQAYVTILNATVLTPKLALADFQRVAVPAMSSIVVNLAVTPRLNSVLNGTFADVVEPGMRTVWVGSSSDAESSPGSTASWSVVGPVTPVVACEA